MEKTWFDEIDSFEREHFHLPLQAFAKRVPGMPLLMTCFGLSCTGESLVCLFGLLGWTISVKACTTGIWLVPVVEVLNGLIKWQFGRPRPGWKPSQNDSAQPEEKKKKKPPDTCAHWENFST